MLFTIHLITALSAISAANAAAPGVSCWKSGPSTKPDNILNDLPVICAALSGAGYVPNEDHYTCVLDKALVKWDFALTVRDTGLEEL